VFARIADGQNLHLERIVRFHPVTVVLAATWMELLRPLTTWIAPHLLLKALFAAVGAVGVWAAMVASAAVLPRGYALLCGVIYAVSFGIWYFASVEESKIVTASLSALYIAAYLHLRERWSARGAAVLTVTLLFACLNEIVAGFLIVIPIVDTLMRRGWDWRQGRWIAAHALAGPLALVILEAAVNGWLVPRGRDPEGASHLSMLLFYISENDYGITRLYSFVVTWLFFNIIAPSPEALIQPEYGGYFEPALAYYFSSPIPAGLVALLGAMLIGCVLPRYRPQGTDLTGIIAALAAFALVRAGFFFLFNPQEALLFSPAATLAHIYLIAIPFAASRFPGKRLVLALFAALLFANNGAYFIGP
jgi:hypothetical protein